MYYRKTYKVSGEDVDDFMVMQYFAYHAYASSILNGFLFEKGYSIHKLHALKIGVQARNEKLVYRKKLNVYTRFFCEFRVY